jgi:hypothetical protein
MAFEKRLQLYFLGIAFGAALAAGCAKPAYPEIPMIVPLMLAWISGAAWSGVFVFRNARF